MAIRLKQSTASQEVPLGYFVDSGDGNTEETSLTIANTDIKLWKAGATTLANKNSGGATHISNGVYYAVLDATDTNTLGPLIVFVHVSGALPVRVECEVLAANVYDSLIGGTDTLDVQVTGIGANVITATSIAADAITDAKVASDVTIASVTGAVGSVTGNVGGNVTGSVGSVAAGGITASSFAADAITAAKIAADVTTELQSGLATAAALTSVAGDVTSILADTNELQGDWADGGRLDLILDARASQASVDTIDDFLDTEVAAILADTNELQTDWVNGGRLDLLIDAIKAKTDNLPAAPAATGDIPTAADVADAVWDEALAGHAGAGSAGEALAAAGTAGDPWTTALPGSYSSGQAGYIIGTNLDATVGSRLATAGYTAPLDAAGVRTAVGLASANLDTQLAAIDDAVDTEVAAILAAVDTEVAAIKAKTDNLPASPAATGDIPTAGAVADAVWDEARADHTTNGTFGQGAASVQGNVTGSVGSVTGAVGSVTGNVGGNVAGSVGSVTGNVGGNVTGSVGSLATQAKADVNAEVDAAIETYHLDHLLAATYDPASKPGAADALLNELIENDGGVARFTANALEEAPSGGASAADVADAVWDEPIADHIAAGTTANALNSATAAGNPWEAVIEGSLTAEDILRVLAGVAAGKTVIVTGSGGTATVTFRDITDSGDIVEAQMVGSQRQSVTVTP